MCSCAADTLFENLLGGAVALVILIVLGVGALRVRRRNLIKNETENDL